MTIDKNIFKWLNYLLCGVALSIFISGCNTRKLQIYRFDNGDDYYCEGVRRIVDKSGKIGFVNEKDSVVIEPQFAFAYPFEYGMSKATYTGHSVTIGEYRKWESSDWVYVRHDGTVLPSEKIVEASGSITYCLDKSPLRQTVITRLSDMSKFLSDDTGNFHVRVQVGDSLNFSYIGTTPETIQVLPSDTSLTICLKPYMPQGVDEFVYNNEIVGRYIIPSDDSSLRITPNSCKGGYDIEIELFRLTAIDEGFGSFKDGVLAFKATDASGNPISGEISFVNDSAKLTFTDSSWEYLPNGTTFTFLKSHLALEKRLKDYVASKDARIGVAIIVDGVDTVSVNGKRDFPMLSVYKFPQALAVADYCGKHNVALDSMISVSADEIKTDTWSPLRDKYGVRNFRLPLSELLRYSLQQSDNNACDILFRVIGGPQVADSLMKAEGFNDIVIESTEDDMHRDIYLCYQNRSTPLEMARLFDKFYRLGMRHDSPVFEAIGDLMLSCNTGSNRLAKPLLLTNARIGHKTGTGDRNSQDRIIGVNDAGYVFLPNKPYYAIAVFYSRLSL